MKKIFKKIFNKIKTILEIISVLLGIFFLLITIATIQDKEYLFTFIFFIISIILFYFSRKKIIHFFEKIKTKFMHDTHHSDKPINSINNDLYIFNNSEYIIECENKFVDNYIILDLQTTGLNSSTDEITEIGALKFDNNKLIDTFQTLVKPSSYIPENIIEINGITNKELENAKTIEFILPKFIDFIEDYTLIAHNNSFDLTFLLRNLQKYNIPCIKNKTIDTLSLSRKYLPYLENYQLETLKEFFKIDNNSHRAIHNCEATNKVYQYCKKEAENKLIKNKKGK